MEITPTLVKSLIHSQFPQWSHLPIHPVKNGGHDNRTFHLGDLLSVRLPSAAHYVAAVEKEAKFLPLLQRALPLPIPVPIALGTPSSDYPYPWSVLRWIDGETLSHETIVDQETLAKDLAAFLLALYSIDASDGPAAGTHNFHRGGNLAVYDEETQQCLRRFPDREAAGILKKQWELALASRWAAKPVWVHGDVAKGNLLAQDGKLCAVIDFGTSGVGDPSCDLVMAWTFFHDTARAVFRACLPFDRQTWNRARGWALWKALITDTEEARGILDVIIREGIEENS